MQDPHSIYAGPITGDSIMERVRFLVNSPFSSEIERKKHEFTSFRKASKEEIFGELCFCLLTANTSAEMGVRTMEAIGLDNFLHMSESQLSDALKKSLYRFYNRRGSFIVQSRWIIDELSGLVNSGDPSGTREYLVENVKGLGYKESSHFLRNVGVFDFAILDKHILRMLREEHRVIPSSVASRRNYLETETIVLETARKMGLEPGILDLYMWKIATGKLIK